MFNKIVSCLRVGMFGAICMLTALMFMNSPSLAKSKNFMLRFSHHAPPNSEFDRFAHAYAKKVKELTGGRVTMTIYPAQSLVKASDYFSATSQGVCDINWGATARASELHLNSYIGLPFMGYSSMEVATKVRRELLKKFPEMAKEFNSQVKLLSQSVHFPITMHAVKKEIRVPEDIRGSKIASFGPIAKFLQECGASPVYQAPGDLYMSLERGLVEGVTHSDNAVFNLKVHTLTPYHTDILLGQMGLNLIMNLNKWNSLPADVKKVFDDISEWADKAQRHEIDSDIQKARSEFKKLNHKFTTLTSEEMALWRELVKPVHEEWIKRVEKKGLPARAVYEEALQLINKYNKEAN